MNGKTLCTTSTMMIEQAMSVCLVTICGHHEPCRIPHKPCSIGVLCRAYKGGNPYQSSFTADTGTYRLCADKVVCKRVYEVERILLN